MATSRIVPCLALWNRRERPGSALSVCLALLSTCPALSHLLSISAVSTEPGLPGRAAKRTVKKKSFFIDVESAECD